MNGDAPSGGGDGGGTAKNGKDDIEKIYQKKSQLEHILLRPDTYIGSVEPVTEMMWLYNKEKECMEQREVSYVPGLYKIYDEILVNAADNKQRDSSMDCIKITIDAANNTISVWNNGKGIPVVEHKEEKMYVPTMIFGHLLTSSNYNDEEQKVTGGRNGFGAKLCNIFSTKFMVETASKEYKKAFKQVWTDNMMNTTPPKITDSKDDFTKVTFSPDLAKFKMTVLDDDIVDLMSRRAYDICASTKGVKVYLNGMKLPVKDFKDYVSLYLKECRGEDDEPLKLAHEESNNRWEIAVTTSEKGFQHMSFVNSIATTKGGRHVDYITDMLIKQLIETIKKKNKGGMTIKPFQIKNHLWVFVNCLIVNPTFDSQTKETMTLQAKNFGSKCTISEKFMNTLMKTGVVENILMWAKFKADSLLAKTSGKKQNKLRGLPKLEDANDAGTKNSIDCTLILTEGDSAKSLAVSGLGVVGRDKYGVFPLRGKLLNVREASHKQIMENAEINNLVKILGLQYKKKYENTDDMKSLRYGRLMIMTDQDQDGSHIKGLIINFVHHNWPSLLKMNFLEEFITPIIKATKGQEELSFYSIPEFLEWQAGEPQSKSYRIKYYKGLGTSTSKEAKEYFQNLERHRILFKREGDADDKCIVKAFSKKEVDARKDWLTKWMALSKERKERGLNDEYLYEKDTRVITYEEFINKELILFSNMDNERSIPSVVDGLKPGSRKVIFTCFKRNKRGEMKVAQLAGAVGECSAYHHGEQSLTMTIVNLAQNYVGSNNINLLQPRGQFGTRLQGGKDAASARYIFTMLSPLARLIFPEDDDPLLHYLTDDNKSIEPDFYVPIIPMVLVNGADGIGTGWMTKIPNHDPREIIGNLKRMIRGEEPLPMKPWYKNFRGEIEGVGDKRFVTSGEVAVLEEEKFEITELPIGTWTQAYKENVLEPMLHGGDKCPSIINDYKEYNTDTTVKFQVMLSRENFSKVIREGVHKTFKLQSTLTTTSMCAFDKFAVLKRYDSALQILKEFYEVRMEFYVKRKAYKEGMLQAQASKLSNQARFIVEKCDGILIVENRKRKEMLAELVKRKYDPDPVMRWEAQQRKLKGESAGNESSQEEEEDEEDEGVKNAKTIKKNAEDEDKNCEYDYLLGMKFWSVTMERKEKLLRQRDEKFEEYETLKRKTPADLWMLDLDALSEKLNAVEAKERDEEMQTNKKLSKAASSKSAKGKKRRSVAEDNMPSKDGERIAPIVDEGMKLKAEKAEKAKENKGKPRVKKEAGEKPAKRVGKKRKLSRQEGGLSDKENSVDEEEMMKMSVDEDADEDEDEDIFASAKPAKKPTSAADKNKEVAGGDDDKNVGRDKKKAAADGKKKVAAGDEGKKGVGDKKRSAAAGKEEDNKRAKKRKPAIKKAKKFFSDDSSSDEEYNDDDVGGGGGGASGKGSGNLTKGAGDEEEERISRVVKSLTTGKRRAAVVKKPAKAYVFSSDSEEEEKEKKDNNKMDSDFSSDSSFHYSLDDEEDEMPKKRGKKAAAPAGKSGKNNKNNKKADSDSDQ